ncbi:MAG: bifunctional tetrahydrofolate synthase/dihydrofolate synthase [Pseudomonadales bacterium]|nr:bifunctional tetrahydrofolate synthase/dihydrofolate synthase [Pseudomonadales bacterium]
MDLTAWLERIDQQHPVKWDLGLARVGDVAARLGVLRPARQTVLVAGTNGKGTTCEYLSALAVAKGLRTGKTTSPHLRRFNERIVIDQQPVSDQTICEAFEAIEQARGDTTLTYFEYGALAALYIFTRADLDLAILEIGLGGRLDAFNIVDPDISVITRIALDHQAWLGDTRDLIAVEKAGILRSAGHAVVADPNPPEALASAVADAGCSADWLGVQFGYDDEQVWYSEGSHFQECSCAGTQLPRASLAAAVQVLSRLSQLPPAGLIQQVAADLTLPGRFQQLGSGPRIILDVAHNPDAAAYLLQRLERTVIAGQLRAVAGMYADKEVSLVLNILNPLVSAFYFSAVDEVRAAPADSLLNALPAEKRSVSQVYDKVSQALAAAIRDSQPEDVVVVFGSFPVVGNALDYLESPEQSEIII